MQEFGYLIDVDEIDAEGQTVAFSLDDVQRAQLAARLGLQSLQRLDVAAQVRRRDDGTVIARGTIRATVVQSCVVTLDPVEAAIEEPFEVCYVPAGNGEGPEREIEIGADDDDIETFDGSTIDLGRTAVEYLALAIDPYPRRQGAEFSPETSENGDSSPFAVLAKLRNNL